MSMSTVLSGRSGFSCDFKKTEDFFAKDPKLAGVRHASAFSRGMRGGGGRAVGFNQPDSTSYSVVGEAIYTSYFFYIIP